MRNIQEIYLWLEQLYFSYPLFFSTDSRDILLALTTVNIPFQRLFFKRESLVSSPYRSFLVCKPNFDNDSSGSSATYWCICVKLNSALFTQSVWNSWLKWTRNMCFQNEENESSFSDWAFIVLECLLTCSQMTINTHVC